MILDRPPNDPFLRKKEPSPALHPAENRGRKLFGGRDLFHSNHDEERMREMIVNEQISTTRQVRRVHQGEEAET